MYLFYLFVLNRQHEELKLASVNKPNEIKKRKQSEANDKINVVIEIL